MTGPQTPPPPPGPKELADVPYRLVTEIRRDDDGEVTVTAGEPMSRELAEAWFDHAKKQPPVPGVTLTTRIEPCLSH